MVNKCIDAHHHLWRYEPAEYPWMTDGMEILRRDFLLGDLKAVTAPAGIAGTVVVEAARRIEETIWLAEIAASDDLILLLHKLQAVGLGIAAVVHQVG